MQLISVSMVQWLKRSPKTREVVSSGLNSDCFFVCLFSLILLHVLMLNYLKIEKIVLYVIK